MHIAVEVLFLLLVIAACVAFPAFFAGVVCGVIALMLASIIARRHNKGRV